MSRLQTVYEDTIVGGARIDVNLVPRASDTKARIVILTACFSDGAGNATSPGFRIMDGSDIAFLDDSFDPRQVYYADRILPFVGSIGETVQVRVFSDSITSGVLLVTYREESVG